MIESKNIQLQKQFKVLLIGDSCIDEYNYGSIDRLSPEAPVPILKFSETKTNPGMAANVNENLLTFGLTVEFITNTEQIKKIRYVDIKSGQHLLRVDHDIELLPWSGYLQTPLIDYDAIVISDYNKGFVTYELVEKLRKEFTGPIFVDTKKQDLLRFNGCYVKINEAEYNASTSKCENLIITKGRFGAEYKGLMYPTIQQDIVDVCGAGDTFLASLVYEYLNTMNIIESINFANKCSSIAVSRRGVYVLTQEDVKEVRKL